MSNHWKVMWDSTVSYTVLSLGLAFPCSCTCAHVPSLLFCAKIAVGLVAVVVTGSLSLLIQLPLL